MPGSECPVGDWLSLKLPYRTGQLEIGHGLRWLLEPFAFESTLNAFETRVRPGSEQLLNTGQQLAEGMKLLSFRRPARGYSRAGPGCSLAALHTIETRRGIPRCIPGRSSPAGSFDTKQ